MSELLPAALVLFLASGLQGLTGFGYSLFSLPLLVLFMPASSAVPVLSVTSLFLNFMVYHRARGEVSLVRLLPLMLAGVAGLPVGVWLLRSAEESVLKLIIGGVVVFSSVMLITGLRVRLRREKLAMVPVGLLSGVLNGSTTMSGPPVILFMANQGHGKHSFRGGLAAYFLLLNLAAVPAFIAGGVLTGPVALNTAKLFPAVLAGTLLGIRLADSVKEKVFRKIVLFVLAALGILSIVTGIGGLLS